MLMARPPYCSSPGVLIDIMRFYVENQTLAA